MQVAIIGSGRVGSALAQALGRAGHEVRFGSRKPDRGKAGEAAIADAVAGDDATLLGLPLDAGRLGAARLLEPLALLWIELARKRGGGANFTFTLQRKA